MLSGCGNILIVKFTAATEPTVSQPDNFRIFKSKEPYGLFGESNVSTASISVMLNKNSSSGKNCSYI